jgi:hypothetical protein
MGDLSFIKMGDCLGDFRSGLKGRLQVSAPEWIRQSLRYSSLQRFSWRIQFRWDAMIGLKQV